MPESEPRSVGPVQSTREAFIKAIGAKPLAPTLYPVGNISILSPSGLVCFPAH